MENAREGRSAVRLLVLEEITTAAIERPPGSIGLVTATMMLVEKLSMVERFESRSRRTLNNGFWREPGLLGT